ncbi:hypothetical protein PV325_000227, partial [Microctonus aethiopoides]
MELALWDEPNAELRRQSRRLWDTMKGVGCLRQQDGGHGSRNPLRSGLEREEHRSCGGVRIFPSDLENPGEGHVEVSRWFVPISAAGLQGEEPLVDRI